MAFERLRVRQENGPKKGPAAISLTGRARPRVNLTLSGRLAQDAGLTRGGKVHLSLGTGADAGKIRIESAEDGAFTARLLNGGAVLVDGGFIEAIGTSAQKKRSTSARSISPGIVEVDIPAFGADEIGDDACPSPNSTRPKAHQKSKTVNGVAINLTLDDESVTFAGKTVEVTTRQARFIYLLARPRPTPVAVPFLTNALWDGKPPATALLSLKQMAADLQTALSPIGLSVNLVKGVGYQLKDC